MIKSFKLKTIAFFVLLLICLSLVFTSYELVYAADGGTEGDRIESVQNYLSRTFSRTHFPAMSVIIVDGDSVLFSQNYGKCNSSDKPFLLGSVSKSFTALCIMQLVEEGKIDLNAKISEYLPQAKCGDRITVQQLLNHTSGLGEHDTLKNYKIKGTQGKHVYANVNYTLLGKIVESVSGKNYATYVTENVFEPLGMTKSAATYSESVKNGLIDGCTNYFGFNVKSKPHYPKSDGDWITTAAGYLSASANDLGRYLQMYLNGGKCAGGDVLSQSGVNAMFSNSVRVDADIPYEYCLGWTKIGEPMGETVMRHSGLVETGMSSIYILPESGLGVAVLVNSNDYFVGKDFMDRLDWSIPMILTGMQPNEIGANEYATAHALYDLAYIAAFIISVLPLCFIELWLKRSGRAKPLLLIIIEVLIHALLPSFILALPTLFFKTPLWVVMGFVPDMFITLIVSSVLLYAAGVLKIVLFALTKKGVIKIKSKEKINEE